MHQGGEDTQISLSAALISTLFSYSAVSPIASDFGVLLSVRPQYIQGRDATSAVSEPGRGFSPQGQFCVCCRTCFKPRKETAMFYETQITQGSIRSFLAYDTA